MFGGSAPAPTKKAAPKTSAGLFGGEDDDLFGGTTKSAPKEKEKEPTPPPETEKEKAPEKKASMGLFGEEDDSLFGAKTAPKKEAGIKLLLVYSCED